MNNEINVFEVATKNKYRFPYRGQISVEDMWDLSVTELDKIFKTLNKQVKTAQEESLLETKTKEDETIENQIAIVRHIVSVKQKEANDRLREKERKAQKQRIMEIMADKEDEALKSKSTEELRKMLEELD